MPSSPGGAVVTTDPAASDRDPGETDHGLDRYSDDQQQARDRQHQGGDGPLEAGKRDRCRIEIDDTSAARSDYERSRVDRRWRRCRTPTGATGRAAARST
jgi:hypothetical protein